MKSNQKHHTAEPIKNKEDLNRIRTYLLDSPRDLLLFDLAIETGVGMKKLLNLRVKNLSGLKEGEKIPAISGYGDKYDVIMTPVLFETLQRYLDKIKPKPDAFLFKTNKGSLPLNLSTVSNMIKDWFEKVNIKGCSGAISLRKTWEYNQKRKFHAEKNTSTSNHLSIFKPIETPSAQQTVFNELFNAIISGKIPPGTKLTTDEISKAFKLSQAPVRVALNWLEARGFISAQRKSGSIVKELTIEELHEIVQIRMMLETAAAKLCYKVRTNETLTILESIIEKSKSAHTFEELDQLNRLFHQNLYRDANMPLLTKMIIDLYDRFSPYAILTFKDINRIPDHATTQNIPQYYQFKIIEGMRRKNIAEILKYLKMKISRSMLITEEVLKQRQK